MVGQRVLALAVLAPIFRQPCASPPSFKLDTTGWSDKQSNPIWSDFSSYVGTTNNAGLNDLIGHVSKLQHGLLSERAALNIFLFTGPDEKTGQSEKNLTTLSSRNGGKFCLLTTKRLKEFTGSHATAK